MTDSAQSMDLADLRRVVDYQFGDGAGSVLFPQDEDLSVRRTSSGRIQQVHASSGRLVTLGIDGRVTLSVIAGRRLFENWSSTAYTVTVGSESAPYIRSGRNAFAKFIRDVDPAVRPGDEVIVVYDGTVVGVGRAELSATGMIDFETGMAVQIRDGADR